MKPERRPCQRAKVIVFLDANMPNVRECERGCSSNRKRMCLHRFGPHSWVCDRPTHAARPGSALGTNEVPFNRFKDLQVVLWWVAQVLRRWADRKGVVRTKRFVLATHDAAFITAVHKEYTEAKERGYESPALTFSGHMDPRTKRWVDTTTASKFGRVGWIRAGDGKTAILLEIFNLVGGDRDQDLREVRNHCRQLRRSDPPRPQ